MAFIKRSYLEGIRPTLVENKAIQYSRKSLNARTASAAILVFLSHSHFDWEIIEEMAVFLRRLNSDVYIDWQDASLPIVTNAQTARELKQRISDCTKFILVATVNSLDSKWVPWELGVADSFHGPNKIAILPVVEDDGSWKGREYIGMYPRISTDKWRRWRVYSPGSARAGQLLRTWLTSG